MLDDESGWLRYLHSLYPWQWRIFFLFGNPTSSHIAGTLLSSKSGLCLTTNEQGAFGWTKWDLDGKNILHFMVRARNLILLSHGYWTHCSMIIGHIVQCLHIVQWLLDTLSNFYLTNCPIYIGQNPKFPMNILHLVHQILVYSIFHGQYVQDIKAI